MSRRPGTLRLLLPYVRRELRLYAWGFVGSLFRFLIPLAVPLVLRYIFDELLQNGTLTRDEQLRQLTWIGLTVLAAFLLVRAPMEYVRQFGLHKANNNVIRALREDAFDKLGRLDAQYFADHKSGEIGTRFFDDVEKARGYMTALFSNIWIETVVLTFVVGAMLAMNAQLALLAVLLVAFQFGLAHLLSKRFKRSTAGMMQYRSVLNGFILEKIQGAVIARLFASDSRDRQQLDRHLDRYEELTDRQAKLNAFTLSAVNVLSDLTPFAVVLTGSLLVTGGSLTAGSLIAFFAYVDRMRGPVAALVQAFPAVAEGSVALSRIFDFLRTPAAIREKEQPAELRAFADAIRFDGVSIAYEGRGDILRNVSFTLEKGKTYAFVGESGGGKSTILQLVNRLYDPTRGRVLFDGIDLREVSLASLRTQIGMVTQDNFLYSASIRDNIRMAKPDATEDEIAAAARKAHADAFIRALPDGYDTEIGERGVKLSGGQKQRIALARVFLKNPPILVLDEATSALDNESEKLVQASIEREGKEKTVIMIAHRLQAVIHADTIFVVRRGQIVAQGTHEELLRAGGYYRELYTRQADRRERSDRTAAGPALA